MNEVAVTIALLQRRATVASIATIVLLAVALTCAYKTYSIYHTLPSAAVEEVIGLLSSSESFRDSAPVADLRAEASRHSDRRQVFNLYLAGAAWSTLAAVALLITWFKTRRAEEAVMRAALSSPGSPLKE